MDVLLPGLVRDFENAMRHSHYAPDTEDDEKTCCFGIQENLQKQCRGDYHKVEHISGMEEEGEPESQQKPQHIKQENNENDDADPVCPFPFLGSLEMLYTRAHLH